MKISNRDCLIWLNSLGIGSNTIRKLSSYFGDIKEIWSLSNGEINSLNNIHSKTKDKITGNKNTEYLEKTLNALYNSEINVITIEDKNYPLALKNIYNRPKVLYYKGDLDLIDSVSLSIVGSRKVTRYGDWATKKIVKELVDLGVTIVSGMALGIDTISHRIALDSCGKTIAVLGSGLDKPYPKRNKDLFEEIGEKGLLLSEYFLGMEPLPYHFPERNRIISGLSLGTVIVEAKERSGSLITGYHALEQGKEVFAIPGNINSIFSRGTNRLIQDGAKLVMDIEDIIEELYELENLRISSIEESKNIELSSSERLVFEEIKKGPKTPDELIINTEMDIRSISGLLTVLELKGLIEELSGGVFSIS